jgi:hypothetical protein
MRFDRLTLFLMVVCQAAQISMTGKSVPEALTALLMLRMYFAYHPRQLARVVQDSTSSSALA